MADKLRELAPRRAHIATPLGYARPSERPTWQAGGQQAGSAMLGRTATASAARSIGCPQCTPAYQNQTGLRPTLQARWPSAQRLSVLETLGLSVAIAATGPGEAWSVQRREKGRGAERLIQPGAGAPQRAQPRGPRGPRPGGLQMIKPLRDADKLGRIHRPAGAAVASATRVTLRGTPRPAPSAGRQCI